MGGRHRIVQLEDCSSDAELVLRELRRGGLSFDVERVHDEASYLQALSELVMTAVLQPSQRSHLAALDVSECLLKPFQAAELMGSVERALASPRNQRSEVGA